MRDLVRLRRRGNPSAPAVAGQQTLMVLTGYVVLSVVAASLSIILTPPFQTPDAFVQFDRAVALSYGRLTGQVEGQQAGAVLPTGVTVLENPFQTMYSHYLVKATRGDFLQAGDATWGQRRVFVPFAATTEYPPVAYFPGAIALLAGRLFTAKIIVGYYLLEAVNAAVFIALVAWALTCFRPAEALLLAAVALLPMEIALASSPSTDGIIFASLCVFAGIIYRRSFGATVAASEYVRPATSGSGPLWRGRLISCGWLDVAAALALASAVIPKPPYIFLVIIAGLPAVRRRDWVGALKSVVAMTAFVGTLATLWYRFGAKFQGAYSKAPTGASIPGQFSFVLHHPAVIIRLIETTLHVSSGFYWQSFVGYLGWLDTPLQGWLYVGAAIGLGTLSVLCVAESSIDLRVLGLTTVAVALTVGAVLGALYLDWTPVGSTLIQGVQGRYFLPLAPIALLGFGSARSLTAAARIKFALGAAVVVALAWLETVGVCIALVGRYWLN